MKAGACHVLTYVCVFPVNDGGRAWIRLVESGNIDLNNKDEQGCTPLIWACRNGHEVRGYPLAGAVLVIVVVVILDFSSNILADESGTRSTTITTTTNHLLQLLLVLLL